MDQPGTLGGLLDLVALQMSDHVPADVIACAIRFRSDRKFPTTGKPLGDLRGSLLELLRSGLAEVHVSHVNQLTDLLERSILGDQNNDDVAGSLTGTVSSGSHSLEKSLVSLAQSGIGTNS